MPFLDHLEELRWRLLKSLISVLIGAVITFYFIVFIIKQKVNKQNNILFSYFHNDTKSLYDANKKQFKS